MRKLTARVCTCRILTRDQRDGIFTRPPGQAPASPLAILLKSSSALHGLVRPETRQNERLMLQS